MYLKVFDLTKNNNYEIKKIAVILAVIVGIILYFVLPVNQFFLYLVKSIILCKILYNVLPVSH
ncbi:hypothetical protein CYQ73_13515 [Enterococcus faecium]|nr:hypothetical protein CYQ73_13515 [Enterococcus faecium]